MQLVDLRPLTETSRVRRPLWLRKKLLWELENARPSPFLAASVGHFEWETEAPTTAEGGLATLAPALLRLLSVDLEAVGLCPFLPGWHRRVMEASRADFELAARSANLPLDPPSESIVSTSPPPESQDGRDARYRFSCPDCGWVLTQNHSFVATVSLRFRSVIVLAIVAFPLSLAHMTMYIIRVGQGGSSWLHAFPEEHRLLYLHCCSVTDLHGNVRCCWISADCATPCRRSWEQCHPQLLNLKLGSACGKLTQGPGNSCFERL